MGFQSENCNNFFLLDKLALTPARFKLNFGFKSEIVFMELSVKFPENDVNNWTIVIKVLKVVCHHLYLVVKASRAVTLLDDT